MPAVKSRQTKLSLKNLFVLIYSKIALEIMWLLVNNMHTIISVTLFLILFFNFRANSRDLLIITSLVENEKLDMWSSKICIIIRSRRVKKASTISNFKSLHSQFHVFALFGINWHALSQSECRNYCMYTILNETGGFACAYTCETARSWQEEIKTLAQYKANISQTRFSPWLL